MAIVSYCPSKGAARFLCAQAGCRACVESLLHEHNGLVWLMVSRQWSGKAYYADLFQEGRIGLWQAILHYDPGRGVAFSSYACVVIRHQVWAAVRHSLKAEGWLEYERTGDSLEALLAAWQQEQIRQALGEALALLPEHLRQVIQLHYGVGKEPGMDPPTAQPGAGSPASASLIHPFAQYLRTGGTRKLPSGSAPEPGLAT
jgi:RNA polymerase sigma factor (sigma-70 family)